MKHTINSKYNWILSLIILVLFSNTITLDAQTNTNMPIFIPKSPNVSALDRFGSYPVSHYTGTVPISVNLYQIPLSKDKSLNIQLNYHSGGIKVSDINGWVGTGWGLEAGGYISREVRGLPDDLGSRGFYRTRNEPAITLQAVEAMDWTDLNSLYLYGKDLEPDIFTLNLNGRMLTFFVDMKGEFRTIPYSNIKVVKSGLDESFGAGTWEVIDETGTKYVFGAAEGKPATIGTYGSKTAWWLTKIISPEGITLASFDYRMSEWSPLASLKRYRYGILEEEDPLHIYSQKRPFLFGYNVDIDDHRVLISMLNTITFHDGSKLKFETGDKIPDGSGLSCLKYIKYIDNKIKEGLQYSFKYLGANGRDYLSEINKKNGLDSILERKFVYNGTAPYRPATSVDYWGYNNAISNSSNLPYMESLRENSAYNNYCGTQNGREATKYAMNGIIKEIHYPTGGYTKFDFENNTEFYPARSYTEEIKINESIHLDEIGEISKEFKNDFNDTPVNNTTIKMEIFDYAHRNYLSEIQLIDLTTGNSLMKITHEQLYMSSYMFPDLKITTNPDGSRWFRFTRSLTLNKGRYKIVLSLKRNGSLPLAPIYKSMITYSYNNIRTINVPAGGRKTGEIRIANIANYDSQNSLLENIKYTYGVGGSMLQPVFERKYGLRDCYTPQSSFPVLPRPIYAIIKEITDTDLNRYSGSPLQYGYVREERTGSQQGSLVTDYYYSRRSFTRGSEEIPPSAIDPSLPYSANDYEGGKLLRKIDYKTIDGTFRPIREERNVYEEINTDVPQVKSIFISKLFDTDLCVAIMGKSTSLRVIDEFKIGCYDLKSAKQYLSEKSIWEFYNDKDTLKTTMKFKYANNNYLQPTATIQYNSNGIINETINKYSYDYNTAISNDMTAKNMISKPFKIDSKVNNLATCSAEFTYGYFTPTSTPIIELQNIKESTLTAIPRNLQYNSYDSYGKPIYITKDDITQVVYLWSYNGQYPIAEIKNIGYTTYAEIENIIKNTFAVTSIDALSKLLTPNETKLKDGSLQNALPNALVTTYTYKPLFGILTATDPRGVTSYYDYDAFGRLKEAYIMENSVKKVIQANTYHYHNQ